MSEFYLPTVSDDQLERLAEDFAVEDWCDGSANVDVPEDDVDSFVSWCESEGLEPELL